MMETLSQAAGYAWMITFSLIISVVLACVLVLLLGVVEHSVSKWFHKPVKKDPYQEWTDKAIANALKLPELNYCTDLNAMNRAWYYMCRGSGLEEESLRTSYGEELERIAIEEVQRRGGSITYMLANLSAEQRADALINVLHGRTVEFNEEKNGQIDDREV